MSLFVISIIAAGLIGLILLFALGACHVSSAYDRWQDKLVRELEEEAERVIRHGDKRQADILRGQITEHGSIK